MKEEFLSLLKNDNNDIFTRKIDLDFVLVMGIMPSKDEALLNALKKCKNIVYLSVVEDADITNMVKIQSRYEAGSEEGVLAILAKELFFNQEISKEAKYFFENLDDGYISAECNVGEEELEEINALYKNSKNPTLVLGYDFYNHHRGKNIAKIIDLFVQYGNFKIYMQEMDTKIKTIDKNYTLENVPELDSFDGSVVYAYPTQNQDEQELLIGSPQFKMAAKIEDKDDVYVITENSEYQRKFILDRELKGTVALLPSAVGDESYYYKVAKIIKREN